MHGRGGIKKNSEMFSGTRGALRVNRGALARTPRAAQGGREGREKSGKRRTKKLGRTGGAAGWGEGVVSPKLGRCLDICSRLQTFSPDRERQCGPCRGEGGVRIKHGDVLPDG